jgi:hypothetical protein
MPYATDYDTGVAYYYEDINNPATYQVVESNPNASQDWTTSPYYLEDTNYPTTTNSGQTGGTQSGLTRPAGMSDEDWALYQQMMGNDTNGTGSSGYPAGSGSNLTLDQQIQLWNQTQGQQLGQNQAQFDASQGQSQAQFDANLAFQQQQAAIQNAYQNGQLSLQQAQQQLDEAYRTNQAAQQNTQFNQSQTQNQNQFDANLGLQQQQLTQNNTQFNQSQAQQNNQFNANLTFEKEQARIQNELSSGRLTLDQAQQQLDEAYRQKDLAQNQSQFTQSQAQNQSQYNTSLDWQKQQSADTLAADKAKYAASLAAQGPAKWMELSAYNNVNPTVQSFMEPMLANYNQQATQQQPVNQATQWTGGATAATPLKTGDAITGWSASDMSKMPELMRPSAQNVANMNNTDVNMWGSYSQAQGGRTLADLQSEQQKYSAPGGGATLSYRR